LEPLSLEIVKGVFGCEAKFCTKFVGIIKTCNIMNAIPGITFEKDKKTKRRYVCVDLEQYGKEITPFLEKVGVIDHDDDFEKAWASAITGEEIRQRMHQRIDAWTWSEK
jgi:hypothetical protein